MNSTKINQRNEDGMGAIYKGITYIVIPFIIYTFELYYIYTFIWRFVNGKYIQ